MPGRQGRGAERHRQPGARRRRADHRPGLQPLKAAADDRRPPERQGDQHGALGAHRAEQQPELALAVGTAAVDLGGREVVALGNRRRLDRPLSGPQEPHRGLGHQDHRHGRGTNPHSPAPAAGVGHAPTIVRPARETGDRQRHPRQPACPGGGARRRPGRAASISSGAWETWSGTGLSRMSAPAWSPSAATLCLVGNHDLAVLGELDDSAFSPAAAAAVRWTRETAKPETIEFLRGLEPADEGREVALYHASPRDPVWEYVLWPDQAAECIAAQAARVSLVGHSHVALFFVMAEDGDRSAARRPGDRAAGPRQGRPGRRRHPARSLRGPLADQSGQRRPAPRRRSARRLAGARHGRLGGHLPPGRVRDRPRRRRDRRQRAARAPGQATLRRAVKARSGRQLLDSPRCQGRTGFPALLALLAVLAALAGCGSDEIERRDPAGQRPELNAALDAVSSAIAARTARRRQSRRMSSSTP